MAHHQQSASSDWGLIEESAGNCQGRGKEHANFFTILRSKQKQCVIGYQFKLGQAFWFGLVKKLGWTECQADSYARCSWACS